MLPCHLLHGGLLATKEHHKKWSRSDGKRPDGLTMVPRKEDRPPTWDVTVSIPGLNYTSTQAKNVGSAAESAALRNEEEK